MEVLFSKLMGFVAANIFAIIGVGGIGGFLSWILKKYVKKDALSKRLDKWLIAKSGYVEAVPMALGKLFTLNAAKWPIVGAVWNKVIEPYLIFSVDLLLKVAVWFVMTVINGFKKGLMSDNPNFADQSNTEASEANKVF